MAWPATLVVTGDLVTAAQLNRLPVAIAEVTLASPAAEISFQSIPQVWTHLLLVARLRADPAVSSGTGVRVQLNGDTVGPYKWVDLSGQGSGALAGYQAARDTSGLVGLAPAADDGAGLFGALSILVPDYAAAIPHPIVAESYADYGGSQRVGIHGAIWKPPAAAAVTRLALLPELGSWVASSIVTLYGLGAV